MAIPLKRFFLDSQVAAKVACSRGNPRHILKE